MKVRNRISFIRQFCSSVNSALNSCTSLQTLKQIHASHIVSNGQESLSSLVSNLSSLYISFNDFNNSVSVLKSMKEPNTFLWNKVIKSHVDRGSFELAVMVYKTMRENGVSSDGYTFPILNRLAVLSGFGVSFAEMVHCVAVGMGFENDVYFCNTMIEAYLKSGCFGNALKVFEEMSCRDLVSWTSMISGYAGEGDADGAFALFSKMRREVVPNEVTMIVMLQTCCSVVVGRGFHGYAIKSGCWSDQSVKNSILKMYAGFCSVGDCEAVFGETCVKDVVSWNILISLYSSIGSSIEMVDCFNEMRGDVEPSIETLTLLISGLKDCENTCPGEQMHCLAMKCGMFDDILRTSFLGFYAKSGDLEASSKLFGDLSQLNCNIWDAMISLVVACMNQGALHFGKAIHACVIKCCALHNNEAAQSVETSILNMYVRCGNISAARVCFDKMFVKDLVSWTSMIEGYATHGLVSEAFQVFHQMMSEGIVPNSVTFLSLLSACTHSGLLHEACQLLDVMKREFKIEPRLDHYTCVVDALGRSGKVKEALLIILKLVSFPDSRIWAALLSAARLHGDQKVGNYAAEKLILDFESDNAGYYTLLSNVQASLEKWDKVEEVRSIMKDKNLMKHPGWSCLEVKGTFHGFVSGDRSHHRTDEIWGMIKCLSRNALDFQNVP